MLIKNLFLVSTQIAQNPFSPNFPQETPISPYHKPGSFQSLNAISPALPIM